jgi:hypothetical protein
MKFPNPPASPRAAPWACLVPDDEWSVYQQAFAAVRRAQVPSMLGGAFGLACYTGRWRNTKDLDLFARPAEVPRLIDALTEAGFADYHDQLAYDRNWIYRSFRDGVIVDVIWTSPNHRSEVGDAWLEQAHWFNLRGEVWPAVPPEELVRLKLFVLQKDRCDWTDVINLIRAYGDRIDWPRLEACMGPDLPLLRAFLHVFAWLAPEQAATLPQQIAPDLARAGLLPEGESAEFYERHRVSLLDSRPWYAAFEPADRPMQL